MGELSRRELGKALGAASAASLLPGSGAAAAALRPTDLSFPSDFRWGCATAAYQIEGAVHEDGRGLTNWDVFSHTPGRTFNGDTGDVADDSYHRYKEDTQLLKALGVSTYRMSLAWSRIFPEGRGQPNPKGVDHYKRVVDDLLANGIEPYITMFHWDLPAALPGGWQNRDTAYAFADYAGYMAGQLSDRVKHIMTVNEIRCYTDLGHQVGIHAPGLKLPPDRVNQVRHHGVLAHGLGVQAIRAHAKPVSGSSVVVSGSHRSMTRCPSSSWASWAAKLVCITGLLGRRSNGASSPRTRFQPRFRTARESGRDTPGRGRRGQPGEAGQHGPRAGGLRRSAVGQGVLWRRYRGS